MDDLKDDLRNAFEAEGYEVSETSRNRDRIRVALLDEGASADDLQSITLGVVDESDVLGFDVTTESLDDDDLTTVVSFRYRG